MTCMYSLRLSPSGILISMGGESEALRLLRTERPPWPGPLPSGGARWRRCGVRPSARCRGIRRACADRSWGSRRRRSRAPPRTRSSICRSSGSACVVWPGRLDLPKSRFNTLRGLISAGSGLGRRTETAMRVIALVQPFLVFLVRLRHRGQFQRRQRGEAADVIRRDLVRGNADVDPVAVVRVGQLGGEPGGKFERVRRAVERGDRHAGDALHHQALVEHGPQRFERRRRRGEEALRRSWARTGP